MIISKVKKQNLVVLEVADTNVLWFGALVTTPAEVEEMVSSGINLVLVNLAKPIADATEAMAWDMLSQRLKKEKGVVLVFAAGEYRIGDVHMRASGLDSSIHYVLQTPEGTVGFFQKEPSETFIKQYSPFDVIVGQPNALASVQIDLDPFYVVLSQPSEEYKVKSGVSEIKEVDHVTVKKIDQSDREGTVTMSIYALS